MDTIGSKIKTLSLKDYVLRRGEMEAEKHRYVKRGSMADLQRKKLTSTVIQEKMTISLVSKTGIKMACSDWLFNSSYQTEYFSAKTFKTDWIYDSICSFSG